MTSKFGKKLSVKSQGGVRKFFEGCRLELAKAVIAKHYKDAPCGIFPCRGYIRDDMTVLFDSCGLRIEICYYWAYFEVFGLTDEAFKELAQYYDALHGGISDDNLY